MAAGLVKKKTKNETEDEEEEGKKNPLHPIFDVHLVPADVTAVGVEGLRCLSKCQFGQNRGR